MWNLSEVYYQVYTLSSKSGLAYNILTFKCYRTRQKL